MGISMRMRMRPIKTKDICAEIIDKRTRFYRMGNLNCCRSSSRQERATELYVVPGARRNPTQEEGYTDPVLPAPHNVSAIIHSSYSIPVNPLTLSINTELTIPCSRTVWPPHHDSRILLVNRLRSASFTYPFRRKPTQHSMEEC